MAFPNINPSNYTYILPEERIAEYPLPKRDSSKLLIYKQGNIETQVFHEIADVLPSNALLYFNNTKVIPARLHFFKDTGAHIEILLDKAHSPSKDPLHCISQTKTCSWSCIVGNKKKWKKGDELHLRIQTAKEEIELKVQFEDREKNIIKFHWNGGHTFASILELAGHIPLPPYIKRDDNDSDKDSYQTVYAKVKGAVAAPTAGLHFTDNVIHSIKNRGILTDELTLHVGAGTFKPIKVDDASEHDMHSELLHVKRENLESILKHEGPIIPVGTTAMRSLESIYWFGHLLENENPDSFQISKEYPYHQEESISLKKSVENILKWMEARNLTEFSGDTSIFIVPGYKFKVCNGIITNFHQPGTTLILLIAALIGEDWKKVYDFALENDYRFLSYGDSSLLIP